MSTGIEGRNGIASTAPFDRSGISPNAHREGAASRAANTEGEKSEKSSLVLIAEHYVIWRGFLWPHRRNFSSLRVLNAKERVNRVTVYQINGCSRILAP
jgi:hypothetical protein